MDLRKEAPNAPEAVERLGSAVTRPWERVGSSAAWWGLLAAAALLPLGLDEYLLHLVIVGLLYGLLALSWDLGARTGQLSLAHAGFFGLGAYTAGILSRSFGWESWLTVPAAMLVVAVVAAGLGLVTLRLTGIYFAIATLAFSEVLKTAALQLRGLTGGAIGISVAPLFGGERLPAYYLLLGALAVLVVVSEAMERSRWHHALNAIRTREEVAGVLGIPVVRYKVATFVVGAAFAGFAGAVYLYYITYVIPYEVFNLSYSVSALVMPILGGLYSTAGPLVGAFLIRLLEEALRVYVPYGYMILYGLILALAVLFLPRGLVGVVARWRSSK